MATEELPNQATGVELLPPLQDSETSHPPRREEFFPPASPAEQVTACAVSLAGYIEEDNQRNLLTSAERTSLDNLSRLVHSAASNEQLANDPDAAQQIRRTTVALLDRLFIDEILNNPVLSNPMPGKSTYVRDQGFKLPVLDERIDLNLHLPHLADQRFMTPQEQAHHTDAMKSWSSITSVDSIDNFAALYTQDRSRTFAFTHPLNEDEVRQVLSACGDQLPNGLIIPVRFDGTCGGLLTFAPEGSTFQPKLGVGARSELPRQDVWETFLEHGKPVLEQGQPPVITQVDDPTPLSPEEIREGLHAFLTTESLAPSPRTPAEGREARKSLAAVANQGGHEQLQLYLQRHREHYQRAFGREHAVFGQSHVLLTRSGVSCNEAAIRVIAENYQEQGQPPAKAYIMPGWYYENVSTIKAFYSPVEDYDDASVAFIDYEPNAPNVPVRFPEGYEAHRETVIAHMKLKARAEAERAKQAGETPQRFYIVVDKTTDPTYQSFHENEDLPSNLEIIETASITKHQKGERNYFFGAAWHWGTAETTKYLEEDAAEVGGTLTPWGIVHLPRITPQQVRDNLDHLHRQADEFAGAFEASQQQLPEAYRWRLERHNFFMFVIPPVQTILDCFRQRSTGSQAAGVYRAKVDLQTGKTTYRFTNEAKFFLQMHGDYDVAQYGFKDFASQGIGAGDSFGLGDTRLSDLPGKFHDSTEGHDFDWNVLRVSIGADTPITALQNYGARVGENVARQMIELQK